MNGTGRSSVRVRNRVDVAQKEDPSAGTLTHGRAKPIPAGSATRPHGVKATLREGNQAGRVKHVPRGEVPS